jgi:hypothetical protein
MASAFRTFSLLLLLALTGCISGIKYGDVPHAQFVSDPSCSNGAGSAAGADSMPLFAVTSRLSDALPALCQARQS